MNDSERESSASKNRPNKNYTTYCRSSAHRQAISALHALAAREVKEVRGEVAQMKKIGEEVAKKGAGEFNGLANAVQQNRGAIGNLRGSFDMLKKAIEAPIQVAGTTVSPAPVPTVTVGPHPPTFVEV